MDADTRAYVADLIRGAEHLYAEAVALLNEAARIAGGQARDAPPAVYLTGPRYYTPPNLQPGPLP